MQRSHISVIYQVGFPITPFQEFSDTLRREKVDISLHEQPRPGPMAGLEWLLPTISVAFIARSYLDGFLKEAGKDHYTLLKAALARMTQRTMETPKIEPTLISTKGKVKEGNPYSMGFSLLAEAPDGRTIKLLLQKNDGSVDYKMATDAFLDFMADFDNVGSLILPAPDVGLDGRPRTKTVTVAFNHETAAIEWINPVPQKDL